MTNMVPETILNNGISVVLSDGTETVIKSYKKGWYTGTNGKKFRHNQVEELPDYEDEDITPEDDGVIEVDLTDGDEDEQNQTMSQTLRKYSNTYIKVQSSSGRISLASENELTLYLAGMTPEDVIAKAERVLGFEKDELAAKYAHLNPGQKRMTAGNRLRAAVKREDITLEDIKEVK